MFMYHLEILDKVITIGHPNLYGPNNRLDTFMSVLD